MRVLYALGDRLRAALYNQTNHLSEIRPVVSRYLRCKIYMIWRIISFSASRFERDSQIDLSLNKG